MPAPSAPAHRAQTIKQAKAAYKSRHQVHLSEREKKQIERSIELDRRAWRAKEAEKRKAEAKAKRDERERKEREKDVGAGMTSQRRCDRFGFVGSQMHLGAFFGGGRSAGGPGDMANRKMEEVQEEAWDGDLDDESMLEALEEVGGREEHHAKQVPLEKEREASTNARIPQSNSAACTPPSDLDLFWDDLDTSTQIARDLATEAPAKPASKPGSAASSSDSEEFNISVEDIEDASISSKPTANADADKKLMPPPALPVKPSPARTARPPAQIKLVPRSKTAAAPKPSKRATPPPPKPAPLPVSVQQIQQKKSNFPVKAAPKPAFSSHLGITMAELESFVDDDLQLTQVDPV